jgi:hypothetical protein
MKYARVQQSGAATVLVMLALVFGISQSSVQSGAPASGFGSALSIPPAQLIQPEALNQLLRTKGSDKTLVLQIAGPGSQSTGLDLLRSMTATLSKKEPIVCIVAAVR